MSPHVGNKTFTRTSLEVLFTTGGMTHACRSGAVHLAEVQRPRSLNGRRTLGEQPAASALTCCKLRHGAHIYQCVVEFADDGCSAATVSIDGDDQGIAVREPPSLLSSLSNPLSNPFRSVVPTEPTTRSAARARP